MTLRSEANPTLIAIDALIDEVLLRTLEPTINALDRLFDAVRFTQHHEGEPDGFDGIERHGDLSRLLSSEWLLAADEPDEFLRRFEQRELSYLRVTAAVERRPQTALVLFDTGPDQLGRPRLAQLACLVGLERRANRVGAELRWGSLQAHERHSAVGVQALDRFLAARTFARPDQLPIDAFVDETLVVSPMPGPPFPARQLILREQGQDLDATLIDHRSGMRRRCVVPMPRPEDGVRLFRNPTGLRAGPTDRAPRAPASNLVFDERGNKLLARVGPNQLAIYPVPNSANDRPGRIRYVTTRPEDGVIAAAGRVKRSVLTVNVIDDGTSVVVRHFGGSVSGPTGTFPIQGGPLRVPAETDPLGSLTWSGGVLRAQLPGYRLSQTTGAYSAARTDGSLRWGRPGFDASATPHDDGWAIRFGTDEWWHRDGPVFGVFIRSRWTGQSQENSVRAVVIDDDGERLVALGPHGEHEQLYAAGERILDAVTHNSNPIFALRTASGRIVLRSWLYNATLYEISP